jgi:hypothetical protein
MLFWQEKSVAQVTPNEGEVQCLLAGSGATFTDFGGLGGDNAVEGAAGNYLNCDCVTTTTICTPDGSAMTAEMTSFGVFSSFDWLVILDIDNPANVEFPSTILDDPANAGLQLFNNSDGVGDGNSEAYGLGAEVNQATFAALTNTVFTGTNPTGCLTFVFRASGVVDDSGWDITTSAASGIGHPGDNLPCGSNVDCFPPSNIVVSDILGISAEVTWDAAPDATSYTLEYGVAGFTLGTGTVITMADLTASLTGLDELTNYSFYILSDCGADGLSFNLGPTMFMTSFTCPPPSDLTLDNITASSVEVSWMAAPTAVSYIVEYGPAGFTPGSGTTITTTDLTTTIMGLDEITQYDVYVVADCGATDGLSPAVGPVDFTTPFINPPQSCAYTLNLFDSFGDGWNGSILTITHNGISTDYTIIDDCINDDGFFATFQIPVFEGLPIELDYQTGGFQNEITYELLDPSGINLFSDGPNPTLGIVYTETAVCPDCPALDEELITFTDITAESVTMNWMGLDSALAYTIEWGLQGFTPGGGTVENATGTSFDFAGLSENTLYEVYIFANCAMEDGVAIGPIVFQTGFVNPPGMCNYILELNDSGFGNQGWDGSFVSVTINNVTTQYTLNCLENSGINEIFTIPVLVGSDVVIGYTQVGFSGFSNTYTLSDSDAIPLYTAGPNPDQGDAVFTAVAFCPDCPAASPITTFEVGTLTDSTALLTWESVDIAMNYVIEYGPTGFPVGAGLTASSTTNSLELEGLNPCVTYDAYVTVDCGGGAGLSTTVGPITFTTTVSALPNDCLIILDGFMQDVNANNATVEWMSDDNATASYIVEYGTLGFTLGTGISATLGNTISSFQMNNLEENTWYNVYITTDCDADTSKTFGPISFQTLWLNDVGIGIISNPTNESCNLTANEIVTVGLTNFGQNPQSLFEYFFAVNGVLAPVSPPNDGFFTGVVGNDSTLLVDFETTFDFSQPGFYLIEAWTNLDGDSNSSNDTLRIEVVTAFPLPLMEGFEDSDLFMLTVRTIIQQLCLGVIYLLVVLLLRPLQNVMVQSTMEIR